MAEDKITLHGMVFYGYHGNIEEEARLGQRFVVDVELRGDLSRAGASDRLEDTVDYAKAYQVIKEVLEGPRHRLLEALAETLARRLLIELPAEAVLVRIKKPAAPLPGPLDSAGVEIVRSRASGSS